MKRDIQFIIFMWAHEIFRHNSYQDQTQDSGCYRIRVYTDQHSKQGRLKAQLYACLHVCTIITIQVLLWSIDLSLCLLLLKHTSPDATKHKMDAISSYVQLTNRR